MRERHRALLVRAARVGGATFGLAAVFVLSAAGGILLHASLPSSRRLIAAAAVQALNGAVLGSFQIDSVERITPTRAELKGVTISDPAGRPVLKANRLEARVESFRLLRTLLSAQGDVELSIPWVRADSIDVQLEQDKDGVLTLARTFEVRARPPKVVRPPTAKPRGFVLDMPYIEVGSAWAQGKLSGLGDIDAETRTLHGSLHVAPEGVSIDTERSAVAVRKPSPVPVTGSTDFHLRMPGAVWGTFAGLAGDIELTSSVKLDGKTLDATVDLPGVKGETLSAWLPGTGFTQVLSARAEAHGTLPELDTSLHAKLGPSSLDARGTVSAAKGNGAWTLEMRDLDLSSIVPNAPYTRLSADAQVSAALSPEGQPRATIEGRLLPGTIATQSLPPADFDAIADARGISGNAKIHEPGLPVEAGFGVTRDGVVTVKATSTIPALDRAPRLKGVARGRAVARLDARLDGGQLDAVVTADVTGLAAGPAKVQSARLNAHAWGKPDELALDASLNGRGATVGMLGWKDAQVTARGPVRSPKVSVALKDDVGPSVTTTALVSFGKQMIARELHVEVGRGSQGFSVTAEHIDVRGGTLDFGGIAVDGLGAPLDGVIKLGTNGFDVKLMSSGLDLDKLSRVLALPGHRFGGKATIDIDVRNAGTESQGCAKFDVRGASIDVVPGIDASLRARFSGTHVEFASTVGLAAEKEPERPAKQAGACLDVQPVGEGAVAAAQLWGDLVLHGSPLRAQTWAKTTGTARVDRLDVDLNKLGAMASAVRRLVPGLDVPLVSGRVLVRAEAAREAPDAPPKWAVSADTTGFELKDKLSDADVSAVASMTADGSVSVDVRARSRTAARDDPSGGLLVAVRGSSKLDYAKLLQAPSQLVALLDQAQSTVRIDIPDRAVPDLLAPLHVKDAPPATTQHLAASVLLEGSPSAPRASVMAYVDAPTIYETKVPALVCLSGGWDGERGTATALLQRAAARDPTARVAACGQAAAGASVVSQGIVTTSFKIPWAELRQAQQLEDVPIDMDANFKLDGLPLAEFADGLVSGTLTGEGGIKGLGRTPEFSIGLQVRDLKVGGRFAYDSGDVTLRSDASGLRGTIALTEGKESRFLNIDMQSSGPMRFANGWVPGFDEGQELNVRVTPSGFKLDALLPLVEPALANIDGELSGMADVVWVKGGKGSRVEYADLAVAGGAFQIPSLGQEFKGVRAQIKTRSPNAVYVEDFQASAVSGSIRGNAAITFDGLRPAAVAGSILTNEANKLKLTVEGVPVGDVWGQVYAVVKLDPAGNQLSLKGTDLHVDLSEAEQKKVQALEMNPDVRVVPDRVATGKAWQDTLAPEQKAHREMTPWTITIGLTNALQIERSGMRLSVMTGGKVPTILYPGTDRTGPEMHGEMRLTDGRVDVVGKFFTIEPDRAIVTFDGDPSNPDLAVRARWDSPDGTRVYAEVTGPLKSPQIQLRSEPARPPSELLAMVLFGGTADADVTRTDAQARTGGGSSAAAAGVGSGVAAAGINRLLQDIVPMGISTRIDTSQTQNVRPTVVIEVARNVTAEATVNTGTIPLGQNPDRYLLTLDWRFLRSWSMRTTVGDAGSSILDVLWTHRY